MKIAINGEFLCRTVTGIERVAIEVTQFLDELVSPDCVELVIPRNAKNIPTLQNIAVITLPVDATFIPKWTQIAFQKYVLFKHRIPFSFSNTCPWFSPGIAYLHDIYCKLYADDFRSKRDTLIQIYSTALYRRIAKKASVIIAVSEYTKKTIIDTYHISPERVHVIYDGVSAYKSIPADENIFARLPQLQETPFYFTLGSLSTRKNLKWIANHAQLYPNELFAVSGKPLPSVVAPELEKLKTLPNIIMTGYLSDSEVKALLAKCKAFVFPSYFEGFGLPPLEALSCGAPIIISNATCLPEIYGKTAHYIDPNEPNVDLEALLSEPVEPPQDLLERYTLKNTAKQIYDLLKLKKMIY